MTVAVQFQGGDRAPVAASVFATTGIARGCQGGAMGRTRRYGPSDPATVALGGSRLFLPGPPRSRSRQHV